MNMHRLWTGLGAFAGILVLILDSRTALAGAQDGIRLCIQTVIPSLFPFFVLSNLMTGAMMGMNFPALRPIGRFFGLPKGAESLLIPSYLGGYPAGAQSISVAWQSGQLSKDTAERLLAYCSNAGPAFLFGMIGPVFPSIGYSWALWAIHIAASLFVSLFFRHKKETATVSNYNTADITQIMRASLSVMANVCGWVILFRVLIAFLNRWFLWLLPDTVQVAVIGLLELSNGCCSLFSLNNISVQFVLCSALLAAGGLCVTMQTASATRGLSLKNYLLGKGLHILFSLHLSLSILQPWLLLPLVLIFIPILREKFRKNSRNLKSIGV